MITRRPFAVQYNSRPHLPEFFPDMSDVGVTDGVQADLLDHLGDMHEIGQEFRREGIEFRFHPVVQEFDAPSWLGQVRIPRA